MSYRLVDMEHDPRCGQFDYFTALQNPHTGVTVMVDVTDFLAALHGRSFFLGFLYALTRAANAVPELRRRIASGGVREYDVCDASYTVMRPSGAYAYCNVSAAGSFDEFAAECRRREDAARHSEGLTEEGDVLSYFFVSCLPWLHYTQIQPPCGGGEDSNPRFAWGKYAQQGGRTVLPVSLFVHHALCDGLHITRFYGGLSQELARLAQQFSNDKIDI